MDKALPQPRRKARMPLTRIAQKLADLAVYYLFPRKTIVAIMAPMRSGSTLLKAVLAQGGNVSHLPEIDYSKYPGNSYHFYRKAYFLSRERIIVLKCPDAMLKPLRPVTPRIKAIVLVRNAEGVVRSLLERHTQTQFKDRSADDWFAYWANCYRRAIASASAQNIEVRGVRYEDLTADPAAVSAKLFAFIGAERQEGIDRYERPKDFEWKWGIDDGGEKIRGLRIQAEPPRDESLLNTATPPQIEAVRTLQEAFGYRQRATSGSTSSAIEVPWQWL